MIIVVYIGFIIYSGRIYCETEERDGRSSTDGGVDFSLPHVAKKNCTTSSGTAHYNNIIHQTNTTVEPH